MKKEKIILFLFVLSLLFVILNGQVLAEERSIFVGDLIEIKISTQEVSRDELSDLFKDFEVVNIKEDDDGFLITLRSFEPGDKIVKIGDKEIEIIIKSTLDEIQRDVIFEGDINPEEAGFTMDGQYLFYMLLIIFLLTGSISLRRHLKKRKMASLSPYQYFINQTDSISLDNDQYFVKLTICFKEYLESKFSCRIRGKTSSEIINSISGMPGVRDSLADIQSWLLECDRLKFTGIIVANEKKQELCGSLVELVRIIEEHRNKQNTTSD